MKIEGAIDHIEETGISTKIPPMIIGSKDRRTLMSDPNSFVNKSFYKKFDGYKYPSLGTIQRYHKKEGLWHAEYDDGDGEDFDEGDMVTYFIDKVDDPTQDNDDTPVGGNANVSNHPFISEIGQPEAEITSYQSKNGETFFDICDKMGIHKHHRRIYFNILGPLYGPNGRQTEHKLNIGARFNHPWVKGGSRLNERGRQTKIKKGHIFLRPNGREWIKRVKEYQDKNNQNNPEHINALVTHHQERMNASIAYNTTAMARGGESLTNIFLMEGATKHGGTSTINNRFVVIDKEDGDESGYKLVDLHKAMNVGIIDKATGKIRSPNTLQEAMRRPDRDKWKEALHKETKSLEDLKVLSHEHRLEDIRKMGISSTPVPLRMLYDVKYNPDGTLNKYKCREVLQGHKGYMRRGEHFTNTFSASPNPGTTRLIQAIMIGTGLSRLSWDIATAYLWASVKEGEEMAIRYPRDMRRHDPKTGEELYAVLKKNIYGHPSADRRYTMLRNSWMMKEFNKDGWTCRKSRCDPCLFIFHSPKKVQSMLIIHTDDCDGVTSNLDDLKYIASRFHHRFKIKFCDSRFMLGIQRDIVKEGETRVLTWTQPDFIDTTFKQFEEHVPKRPINTPFPAGVTLHRLEDAASDEEARKYIKMGYQSLVGSILWASRMCYPEMSVGAHMLCRLMSKPNERAWKCATHAIKYLYANKKDGLQFRSNGNKDPICYYDASNKADPIDGKAQYGYVFMMYNGPILWASKKHNHVGMSSTQNEYMALSQASREAEWLRQLLIEIGFWKKGETKPIIMLGDNHNATLYSREDMITSGNKFILQDYHFAKECIERGTTCTRNVSTKINISDLFTKSVPKQIIERLRPLLKGVGGILPKPPSPPDD